MSVYTYPSNDLERPELLLSLLGSHWQYTYKGHDLVRDYVADRANEEQQAYLDLLETFAAICRLDTPIYHTDNWYMLTLLESDRNSDPLEYGQDGVYGVNPTTGVQYFYGDPYARPTYSYPIPEDLAAVSQVFNRLTSPSLTLCNGVDYVIDNVRHRIVFRDDPLESGLVAKRDVFSGSEVVDQEAVLWLFKGQFDWHYMYEQFGYVLSLYSAQSSENYCHLINAVFDSLVEGSTQKHLQLLLAAMSGLPLVMEAQETVELIQTDNSYLVIATDRHVYRYNPVDTASVSVGDTVYAGQCLTTALIIDEFNRGETPVGLRALTMDGGYLTGYVSGLTFNNTVVPLVVEANVDGKTKVSFELGGFPTDVDKYWAAVHSSGVASGTTLANLLDIRGKNATPEPTAASLPSTMNPLEFLVANVLRCHGFCARINASVIGTTAYGFRSLSVIRKILPPWTSVFLIYQLSSADTFELTGPGSITTPGYVENVSNFPATSKAGDSLNGTTAISEYITIRQVDGLCE